MNWFKKLFGRKQDELKPQAAAAGTGKEFEATHTPEPTKDQFAEMILQRLQATGENGYSYDAASFRLHKNNRVTFLDNSYASYLHAKGDHRETVLRNILAFMTASHGETDRSLNQVREQLVTVVRERAYFSLSQLDMQIHDHGQPPPSVIEPLTRWFVKTLVVDAPSHMALVNEEMLSRWQHTSDELFAIGSGNLFMSAEPRFSEDRRVFRGLWNDDYDSSRVLVAGLFNSLGLDGDPVVTIPNRLTLLVAGSNDTDAIHRMLKSAEGVVQDEPRPQNPAPLVVRGGEVSDFHVDPTSPVFNAVERAHRFAALMYYQEQKVKLDHLHGKQGKSLHVAKYSLFELDGIHCSYAAWPKGESSLLPVVDEISFIDVDLPEGNQCVARVPWARVTDVVPDLLLDANMFPQRFYVSRFPSAEQFARMGG